MSGVQQQFALISLLLRTFASQDFFSRKKFDVRARYLSPPCKGRLGGSRAADELNLACMAVHTSRKQHALMHRQKTFWD